MKHTEESEFDREFGSYESMEMQEADKREVFSRLMNSLELPQKKRLFRDFLNPVVSAVLAAAFLLVGGYFVANQILQEEPAQQASPAVYEAVEKQLSDTFNKEVIIPNHPKYHAQMIWVPYSGSSIDGRKFERERPLGAIIIYKAESNTLDNKEVEKIREMGDFVYGKPVINPLKDVHSEIRVDISNVNAISGEEIESIEGVRIYYKEVEMDTDKYINYRFSLNELTYVFSHKVTGPETPTEARAFVTSFLKQVNE
ncbi:hypothetical protein ABN702_06320 [Bacillus haimaensis]|uniref:hypothetical protein n=1 Tax=Bacillus haimaensis TaxID=3160967 RepID=UPI003AA81CA6